MVRKIAVMSEKAFTLVELPVEIAIISLLSVILPTVHRGKLLSAVAVCLSNIRQLANSWQSFFSKNKNQFVLVHIPRVFASYLACCFGRFFPQTHPGEAGVSNYEYGLIRTRKGA
jgi:hypothetical protein